MATPEQILSYYGEPPPQGPTLDPTAQSLATSYFGTAPAAPAPAPPMSPAASYYAPSPPPAPPPPTEAPLAVSDFAAGASPPPAPVSLPFSRPSSPTSGVARPGETVTPLKATVTEGPEAMKPTAPAAPAPAPKPSGGAPAAPANRDPYGVAAAQKRVLDTYGNEQQLGREVGRVEAEQSLVRAEGRANMAREQAEDAAVEQETARVHRESYERDMASLNEQLDAVRSKKVDPLMYEREHGGPALTIIGGLIGGLYQGLNHMASNPFLDRLDRKAEEWIAMQEKAIGREERGLTEKSNLLQQLRAVYKDEDMARQAARAMYYESVGKQIEAKAAEYDSPAILARAELGANGVARKAEELRLHVAEQAQQRAQAAAAAAAARARENLKEERKWELDKFEAATKRMEAEGKAGEKAGKVGERFVATGQDESGAPVGYLARNAEAAGKAQAAREARGELRGLIDRAKQIRNDQGALGRTLNRSNPNDAIQIYTPEWQTQLRSLRSEITASVNKAGGLGALDTGTLQLLDKVVGDLESRGSESDVRLDELLKKLEAGDRSEMQSAAGTRARKVVGPDGAERIEVLGGAAAAPTNKKTVPREAP